MVFKQQIVWLGIALISLNLASAPQLHANSNKGDTTIKRLNTLLNRSGKDYRVTIRITSRSNNGNHSVVHLMAKRDADPQGDKLQFQITGDDITEQEICLKCGPAGGVSNCGSGSSLPLPEPDTIFPGSILPWEELLVGACGNWVVEKTSAASTTNHLPQQDYQVHLANAAFSPSWANTLITMDADSRDPIYFDRVNHQGTVMRRIKVLEIGATGSWRGIRRAIIEMPEGRVLMEVVRFRKGLGKPR